MDFKKAVAIIVMAWWNSVGLAQTVPQPQAWTDDAAIEQQLDRDRQEQRQTKELKTKLEQTNLELEQEKALAEISRLKKENAEAFNDPSPEGQGNFPPMKVDYIGGNDVVKEAIVSIGGESYQVKANSSLSDNIKIVSISDNDVTIHVRQPQDLTKTVEFKPV